MYRLVIFDLDGTLLDTIGDLAAAGNYALSRMGLPVHETEKYKHFVGNGIPMLIHRMLPDGHTDELHEQCFGIFNEYYSVHKSDLTVPYEGLVELTAELAESGVICCVNTQKAHGFGKQLVRSFYGSSIEDINGQGAGCPLKPSPEAALELCRRYAVPTDKVLYVGDSDVDMHTGAAAGIDACGVLWGFRGREELSACCPKYLVSDAAELRSVICG